MLTTGTHLTRLQLSSSPSSHRKPSSSKPEQQPSSLPTTSSKLRSGARYAADFTEPQLFFSCLLLDSAASHPVVTKGDIQACCIGPRNYAASSVGTMYTVTGPKNVRPYEMEVGVYAGDDDTLVSSELWPAEPALPSCVEPVLMIPSQKKARGARSRDEFGDNRLSGVLPLKTCYLASAPGEGKMWIGSERVDILGAQRMSRQLHCAGGPVKKDLDAGHPRALWKGLGNPSRIVFEHEMADGSVLRDEEVKEGNGSSVTTLVEKAGRTRKWRVGPRKQVRQEQPLKKK